MERMSRLLNKSIGDVFKSEALMQMQAYLEITENTQLDKSVQINATDTVYELFRQHGMYSGSTVSSKSLEKIQSLFSNAYEIHNLQLKLLELLLAIIEKQLNIRSAGISTTCQIKQDQPVLKPDDLLTSRLQAKVYQLLEDEAVLGKYLASPYQYRAIMALWLVLKEGVSSQKEITSILSRTSKIYRIDQNWFVETDKRRYWLSSKAELLLTAFWSHSSSDKFDTTKDINKFFHDFRIVPNTFNLKFIQIRAMMKSEFILKNSAIEYGVCQSVIPSKQLSQASLIRLLTGKRISLATSQEELHSVTSRQRLAWISENRSSLKISSENKVAHYKELTTIQQIEDVEKFTRRLIRTSFKKSALIRSQLKTDLKKWLEDDNNACSFPWVWLLLSWCYHLLKEGGKHKKRLRLTTIRSYVQYVAVPFIREFSGCSPKKMVGFDWADKINRAAEHITTSKKAFFLYFAEFLVQSDLVSGLNLSDIDIGINEKSIDANIVTHNEADSIISVCNSLKTHVSMLAKFCFCLGFYSGLRRGEIEGLQLSDFTYNRINYMNLHVRPNKFRELKSKESSRNIPLECLWPTKYREEFEQFLDGTKKDVRLSKSKIFREKSQLDGAFTLLTEIMRSVTGDPRLRFHHCRHSFCNWTWFRINFPNPCTLTGLDLFKHDYFSSTKHEQLCKRLGISQVSRKKWWALSGLLGHATPDTTISSYFHLSEFIQRIKFSSHVPSPMLLRKFWGQQIHIDGFGRLKRIPPSGLVKAESFPAFVTPEFEVKSVDDVVNELTAAKTSTITHKLSLRTIWEIICKIGAGYNVDTVCRYLNLDPMCVTAVINIDKTLTERSLKRSKHKLKPLVNFHSLNSGNIKAIDEFIKRLEDATQSKALGDKFQFNLLVELLEDLVGAKDCLIRTHNRNPALLLLKLLQVMRFKSQNIRIQWYFPSETQYEPDKLDEYRRDLRWWAKTIHKHLFDDMTIELIIPKQLAGCLNQNSSNAFKVIESDAGKYLKYESPGTINIQFLQWQFASKRFYENGAQKFSPQRTRAFISFLRLIAIHTQLNSL
ncbi:tyrosine-type recombinase/integrase [Shewanella avicenniae]|uniref:Tyrosine-type recombinase/integrase n=1 Tax=Shewanella avicenniae TaxID=2814294 RepID=A0ABX7QV38_9GAMM|nr:tyrosine-type recombinase/integrase [Shewanella avicenniae]QSX35354.1 tyrosine-type recombinase/integrase [Shewanella avicenniae]